MTSKINAIISDGQCNLLNSQVATQPVLNNTTLAANCGFVKNIITNYNVVVNLLNYIQTVTGNKTFSNVAGLTFNTSATTGILGTLISIGNGAATTSVNILSSASTGAQLYINGVLQPLLPAGTAGYSIPLVSNRATTSKIVCGLVATAAANSGTPFNFPTPFTAGCVPFIVGSVLNATPALCGFYQPTGVSTHTGAGVSCATASRNVMYIAVGY